MLIQKIYNNNVVLVVDDETNKELVLTGCGIGFKKKVGEKVDQEKIEKKFVMEDENLAKKITRIATEVDEDIFNVTSKIIEYAKQNLNTELDDYIYVELADHI